MSRVTMSPLTGTMLAWIAVGIVLLTAAVVTALWWAGTKGLTDGQLVTARFDALKIGLSVGIGSGGVLALYLAWRRQCSTEDTLVHQQEVAADTRADAVERRITELYTKAAEQLGSDKAPVRLAGLYALERLAQGNVNQRQTIANVLCAYLRMPDDLPGDPIADGTDARVALRERVQEREVRLTAQRILAHHLRPGRDPEHPVDTFWPDLELDLTGATLVDVDFDRCRIRTPGFGGVTFLGEAKFRETTFIGDTRFDGVTFTGGATFERAVFARNAWFDGASFAGDVGFDGVTFARNASFRGLTFTGTAGFAGAVITKNAWFGKATFAGNADFRDASFRKIAEFHGATFTGEALFGKAAFTGHADFRGADFRGNTTFREVGFTGNADFRGAVFHQDAGFRSAAFTTTAEFSGTTFTVNTGFVEATFAGNAVFRGAAFVQPPRLDRAHFEHGIPPELARWIPDGSG